MDELKKVGKVLIKEHELAILNRYGINLNTNSTIDEALFLIDRFLNDYNDLTDEEYEELDEVANNLMERKYYWESRK